MTNVRWLAVGYLMLFVTLAVSADERKPKTFSYGEHPRQRLDVYGPASARNAPVVVFIHGGGWFRGDKKMYFFLQRRLAREGIVSVAANYRLSPEARGADFFRDGADAVAWTQNHIAGHGGNPEVIFLMGHSAGAHTVSMLGLQERFLREVKVRSESIRGVISLAGPLMLKASEVPQMTLIFGEVSDEEIWPLAHLDGNEPPFLLLQGGEDPLVRPFHAEAAEVLFRQKGGAVTVQTFANHDHMSLVAAFSGRFANQGDVVTPVMKFIRANSDR